jgi:hypothetical protein
MVRKASVTHSWVQLPSASSRYEKLRSLESSDTVR